MQVHEAVQKISEHEASMINNIVKRAGVLAEKHGEQLDGLSLTLDMYCAHANLPFAETGKNDQRNR